jgi:CheY-like chemotaxis protein
MNILFLDDEEPIRKLFSLMLPVRNPDCTFHFAKSGHDALELSRKINFDMIITDSVMPEMVGYSFLIQRAKNGHPFVPTVVISGNLYGELLGKYAVMNNVIRVVPKPVTEWQTFDRHIHEVRQGLVGRLQHESLDASFLESLQFKCNMIVQGMEFLRTNKDPYQVFLYDALTAAKWIDQHGQAFNIKPLITYAEQIRNAIVEVIVSYKKVPESVASFITLAVDKILELSAGESWTQLSDDGGLERVEAIKLEMTKAAIELGLDAEMIIENRYQKQYQKDLQNGYR